MNIISNKVHNRETSEEIIRERLAETYFPATDAKEGPSKSAAIKNQKMIGLLFLAAAIVAGSIIFGLLSKGLDIDITVTKKAVSPYKNLLLTQGISFTGASDGISHLTDDGLLLISKGTTKPAVVAIDLKKPLNLFNKHILVRLQALYSDRL